MTIDELIVKLSLDAAGLKTGAKDAQSAADKLATGLSESAERGEKAQAGSHKRTAASAMAMGKSITDSNTKVAQSFEGILRTGLAFLAMFTGAKTVEDFTRRMVALDAAVGRMAHNVGSTPERVSALAMAVARTGGTFEGATSAVQGLSDAYQELQTTGTNSIMEPLAKLQAAGGKPISLGNDWHKTLLQIGDDLKVLEDKGQFQLADSLGRKILGDPGTANLAKGGSQAILAAEEQSRQHGLITKEQVEAAQKAQAAWADLNQSVTSFGNTLVTDLEPDVTKVLHAMDKWIDANGKWVADDIKADVEAFGKTLSDHKEDIKRFGDELLTVVGIAGKIATAFAAQSPAAQALELFAGLIGTRILAPLSLARAALGLGLMNPAVVGTAAVAGVLASGDPNKALLDGGRPDVTPRDNDLGLPGLDHDTDMPENKAPSDTAPVKSRLSEAWSWLKEKALATGFGDRLPKDSRVKDDQILATPKTITESKVKDDRVQSDPRVRDDIGDIAKSTAKTVDLLKAQQDAATVSNVSPVTVSSGGTGGSGSHASGTDSPGADIGDRAQRGRHGFSGTAPHPASGPAGVPYEAKSATDAMGITQKEWGAFREGVTDIEGKRYDRMGGAGGRFAGRYQMGGEEITETARRLDVARPTNQQFLADPQMQEKFFENYTVDHYRTLMKNPKFAAMPHREQLKILGYAHNQGTGGPSRENGAWGYVDKGAVGRDAFGTAGTAYFAPIARRLAESDKADTAPAQAPTAMAPAPANTPAKAITDAEVFAARQRMVNGSVNPKDKALVDRYLQEQNSPRPPPAPVAKAEPQPSDVVKRDDKAQPLPHPVSRPAPVAPATKAPTASAAPPQPVAQQHGLHEFLNILRDARKLTHHGPPMKVSLDRSSLDHLRGPDLREHMAMLASAQRGALGHVTTNSIDRSSSSETNIKELHVHSQARDATSIARDTHAALIAKREAADKGNYGLA